MALKESTGLRNFRLAGGSLRKAFEDAIINVYSGTAPASADLAVAGTLLLQVTKGSGAVAQGARSTPQVGTFTVGSCTLGQTFILNVTVDGVGPTAYTYTAIADDNSNAKVAAKVAQMLNDIPQLQAISTSTGVVWVASRFAGLAFTIAAGAGSGTITGLTSEHIAASNVNTLKLAAPSSGVELKNSDTWSGVRLAEGTMGYFRMVTSSDDGTQSTSQYRLQGNVSTSGAELNVSNINASTGATETIDSCAFTEPESD